MQTNKREERSPRLGRGHLKNKVLFLPSNSMFFNTQDTPDAAYPDLDPAPPRDPDPPNHGPADPLPPPDHGPVDPLPPPDHGPADPVLPAQPDDDPEDKLEELVNQAPIDEDGEPFPKPPVYRDYEFSASFAQKNVGPAKSIPQTYLHKTKAHLDAIETKYNEIYTVRQHIDDLLKGFKQRLDIDETSELPLCFQSLREQHLKNQGWGVKNLELKEQELRIVGNIPNEDAKEAVYKFNTMLEECRGFLEKQHTAHEFIQDKIRAIEREPVQIQTTQDALQRAKKQLEMIQTWNKQIENLVSATKLASSYLHRKPELTGTMHILKPVGCEHK